MLPEALEDTSTETRYSTIAASLKSQAGASLVDVSCPCREGGRKKRGGGGEAMLAHQICYAANLVSQHFYQLISVVKLGFKYFFFIRPRDVTGIN
jgi:hypothetical protein